MAESKRQWRDDEEALALIDAIRGKPVIALRDDDAGGLDDVVAKGVTMFRAEMMDDQTLWLACYFDNHADERLTLWVRSRGRLEFGVGEAPSDYIDFDGSR